jgi:hypothetical protein
MTITSPVKPTHLFGPGQFDAAVNTSAPTPAAFDDLQDMSITFKRDLKSLQGRGQFSADVCAGSSSISWKATLGALNGRIPSDLVFGAGSNSAQMYNKATNEARTIGTNGGSFGAVTVVNHGTGVFIRDLGVRDPATNLPLVRVASGAAITSTNHYYVEFETPGRYLFHSSREGKKLLLSYEWQGNKTGLGNTVSLTNQPQGQVGDFTAVCCFESASEQNVVTLNSALTSDFEMSTKTGDFGKPTISGMAQPDPYGNIGTFSFSQKR